MSDYRADSGDDDDNNNKISGWLGALIVSLSHTLCFLSAYDMHGSCYQTFLQAFINKKKLRGSKS